MSDVLLAPFSNSDVRDWPIGHYVALTRLLLDRLAPDQRVRVVGTAGQKLRACDVVRPFSPTRVVNECGRLSWPQLMDEVERAACLVGNNSGLAHLGGHVGTPTVCVFGGSHPRREWRPLGRSVVLVSRAIGCSPCQLDRGSRSPYGQACLREIDPADVADAVFFIMKRVARHPRGDDADRSVRNERALECCPA